VPEAKGNTDRNTIIVNTEKNKEIF